MGRCRMASVVRIALFMLLHLMIAESRDLYDVLSVPRGATDQQIKRAYRKLAVQYHPDKVSGSDAEKEAAAKKFAEINHAYDVLSDSEKRKIYDRYGEEGLQQHSQGRGGADPGDIFSQFFGGGFGGFGFGGGQEQEEQTPKGADVVLFLSVSLRDLYVGRTIKVVRDKNVIKPAPGTRECNCKNKVITRQIGPGMYQQMQQRECEKCPNVKLQREGSTLSVHIEPGMRDGQEIKFFEEGEAMVDGEAGDLRFIIRTDPDPIFERQGDDLLLNHTISLLDALVGFSHEVHHVDGHVVTLARQGVTKPLLVEKIEGEGMPKPDNAHQHGDLYVTYTVKFPESLSKKQQQLVRDLFAGQHDEL